MAEEEFLDIEFTRDELRNIIFPEKPVTCRSCHKPRIYKKLSVANFPKNIEQKYAPSEVIILILFIIIFKTMSKIIHKILLLIMPNMKYIMLLII